MKKIISLVLAISILALAACSPAAKPNEATTETEKVETSSAEQMPAAVRIGGLKGPTSIGAVKLMKDSKEGASLIPYEFTLAAAADELTPMLIQGKLDMAAIPANLAAILYNNTNGEIQVIAVNTLGVLSIVEKGGESINTIADLKGRTIYATGKGTSPEYTLRYLLLENGIDPDKDVSIEFKSEPAEVLSALAASDKAAAMLPQPFVTAAAEKVENLRIAIDLTKAWDELETDSTLITGVMVARRAFLEKNMEIVSEFLREYEASVNFAKENVEEAAELTEEFDIIKAETAKKAIPYCNLMFMSGETMKAELSGYLEVLYAQNEVSVGKALPDDGFYFGA